MICFSFIKYTGWEFGGMACHRLYDLAIGKITPSCGDCFANPWFDGKIKGFLIKTDFAKQNLFCVALSLPQAMTKRLTPRQIFIRKPYGKI
jgi:hypothetical protein